MKTLQIKNREIPVLGQGTWTMGRDTTLRNKEIAALKYGIDHGLTLIDTAEMYDNAESIVGEAIKGYDRESLYIVSKFYPHNSQKDKLKKSLHQSLEKLGVKYLDLYLLHWLEEDVDLKETVETLEEVKESGLIKAWGVSNFDIDEMQELEKVSCDCTTNQVLYNLGSRGVEVELLPWMKCKNMPLMAYCPLSHDKNERERMTKHPVVEHIASLRGVTGSQIVLSWLLHRDNVFTVTKSISFEHIDQNIQAMDTHLNEKELMMLEEAFPRPQHKVPLDVK